MAAACDPRNVLTAGDLMAGAAARDAAAADRAQQANWEGEGGRDITVPTISPRERRPTTNPPQGT
jgi:hypothetical protein